MDSTTAIDDLRGIWRLLRRRRAVDLAGLRRRGPASELGRQAGRFAAVGILSTLAYAAIYLLLRAATPAQVANAIALLTTAVGNTAANRRLTFGVRGRASLLRDHAAGLFAFAIALAITGASVGALHAVDPGVSPAVELGVLVAANAVATLSRFVLLRSWIVPVRQSSPSPFKSFERTVS